MNNIRENKYYKLGVILIKISLLAFLIYTVVQFFDTISQATLYIFLGIILTWRIWKFFVKLILLLIQIGIFFYVIYLLIY
ncbi:hypothetical protein [Dysgonomonas termitidis]|uniref:Uncharacterized protein n=1 Tax=Dysgonomonas termitidis TaxID=1516126 RepID=A0ABV9KZM5_9BACT